jgi:uncharacterized protein YcbK (DUF882 family)
MTSRTIVLVAVLGIATPLVAGEPRFFIMGTGTLTVQNAHTGERVHAVYRRPDDTYDREALDRLANLFRSRGDGAVHEPVLRLVEILSHVQDLAGTNHLLLYSGYRSPDYNQTLKGAARASMHTEGLAADVGIAKPSKLSLETLWHRVRALDCCGAGYYGKDGFMHVDVGRPRFWEKTTSRVGENLAGGNARLFARTQYDRYAAGERVVVSVHSLTLPPVRIARDAKLGATPVRFDGDDCIELDGTGKTLDLPAAPKTPDRVRLTLTTCAPRLERTPETIETNPITVDD